MISELFPITDYSKLQYDEEGLYSITNIHEAEQITKIILDNFTNTNNLYILDGNGGLGGNSINFAKYFTHVTSIELNPKRYEMLKNNISLYNLKNVKILNTDSINYLLNNYQKYTIYFFDPPWGGPNYKKHKSLTLSMGSHSLLSIANYLKKHTSDKILVYKLPYNYNFEEFKDFNYKLYKIKNYYIIVILIN
jgi:16S rRNA G966 N2-methylase RsmD